jgi:hypothetical protein
MSGEDLRADARARVFEEHRHRLAGLAYRMLGTLAEAQDVVQETYLRWSEAGCDTVERPGAWLVTTCSRLALDVLKSARKTRETYPGAWLKRDVLDHPGELKELFVEEIELHADGGGRAPTASEILRGAPLVADNPPVTGGALRTAAALATRPGPLNALVAARPGNSGCGALSLAVVPTSFSRSSIRPARRGSGCAGRLPE